MGSAVLTNAVATHVSAAAPTTNFDPTAGLATRTGGAGNVTTYIYFPRPFPLRATILSAKIVFYTGVMPETGTHTFTFQRLGVSFSASKVTWNTRPTTLIAGTKTVSKTGAQVSRQEWEIDITDWMQTVSNGGIWYGVQITVNETIARFIYSEVNPATAFRPRLEATWSDAPAIPTGLAPSAGRRVGVNKPTVRATYLDVSGATGLQAAQVQLHSSDVWNAVAPGPLFDTGIVLTSVPEVNLALPYARTVSATTTNTSTNITAAAGTFETADVGQPITGTGIPGGATITAVAAGGASATLSAAATTSATNTMTITRTYPGLADGATTFWRIRFQDAAGIWSGWSAATTFVHDVKGSLTVNNPPSGTPVVEDATPPITWSFSGETQAAYQIQITHLVNNVWVTDWDSGKVTSTATSVTVPAGAINEPTNTTYTVRVRIWDNKQREATPGDPTYVEVARAFTFVPGATAGVPTLTAVPGDPRPTVALTWTRSVSPDRFNVLRNGKVIAAALDPAALFVSGTTYTWTDHTPSPGRPLAYQVQAVVNNIASASNDIETVTVRSKGVWLRDPATGLELVLTRREDRELTLGEQSGIMQAIAPNAPKVKINQSLSGLEGRIEGNLSNVYGRTAQQWRDQLIQMHLLPARKFYLTLGDYTAQVVATNFAVTFRGLPDAVFRASFDVYQQDSINSIILGS